MRLISIRPSHGDLMLWNSSQQEICTLPLLSIPEAIDKIELTGASGLGQMRQEPGLIQRRDKLCMAWEECNPPNMGEHRGRVSSWKRPVLESRRDEVKLARKRIMEFMTFPSLARLLRHRKSVLSNHVTGCWGKK